MEKLISRNPATQQTLQEFNPTLIEDLPQIFAQAHQAQAYWRMLGVQKRARYLIQLRETLLNHIEDVVDCMRSENGKPQFEAMSAEILPTLDTLTYFAAQAPKVLKNQKIPLHLMKHRSSYLNYWPVGVVAVFSPWNYPFFLPVADILMALVAGNAVIFKPSEICPMIGLKIQELCNEAGLPPNVLQTVLGGPELGAAIIQQKPGKIFFTGSTVTGKKIMAAASEHLIPVNLELGGKDAMIVLPDADIDFATSAALWGGWTNSGQTCASVERILVHERISTEFLDHLQSKVSKLRQGAAQSEEVDLGVITAPVQKAVYSRHLEDAKAKSADILMGGAFSANQTALLPTVVTGKTVEDCLFYKEETFGPVVAVTSFKSVSEAIQKANSSPYGLAASIITKNISLAEEIARQLEVGTVTINEVAYTAGLGETPWGGVKGSGFGHRHGLLGLYEFVNVRHIHKPRFQILTFKSFWWFPYSPFQSATLKAFFGLYRRRFVDKLAAIPHVLLNLIQFIKTEKRL